MPLLLALVLFAGYSYPSYFKADQKISADIILDQVNKLSADPHFYMAIAWVESRVKTGRVSHTGDYGLFQINYNFWGKKWGYKDRKKFLKDKKYEDLPFAQRDMIDQKVKKVPSSRLDNLAKKLLPKARAAEKERIERLRDKD